MSPQYFVNGGRWVYFGSKVAADLAIGRKQFRRFDDVWDGLLWRLARDPQSGYPDGHHSGILIMETPGTGSGDLPRIAVLYRYDAAKVFVLRVCAKL